LVVKNNQVMEKYDHDIELIIFFKFSLRTNNLKKFASFSAF
jgi:hypothetical protein